MSEAPEMPLYMRRDGLDPVPELGQVRDADGIMEITMPSGQTGYVVTRYDDIRTVFGDAATFSNSANLGVDDPFAAPEFEGLFVAMDPPEHTRLRKMVTPEFTARRMRRIEPRITEIVDAALDDLERAGKPADLVSLFALPVPSLVICELLGVPYAERAEFQARTARFLDTSLPYEQRQEAGTGNREYMRDLVVRARAEPGEDLLGMLVREHGDDLTTGELAGVADLLLVAGHETTANMLSLGTLALLRNPDQLALVRDDPAAVDPAIEELLRWLSILRTPLPRITTKPVEIAGKTLPEGAAVLVSLVAGNRDGSYIDDPETLDVTRSASGHIAFGHGVHHCIGAPLARMEMRIAFPALLRRFPSLALADPGAEPDFRVASIVYGLNSLPVTW